MRVKKRVADGQTPTSRLTVRSGRHETLCFELSKRRIEGRSAHAFRSVRSAPRRQQRDLNHEEAKIAAPSAPSQCALLERNRLEAAREIHFLKISLNSVCSNRNDGMKYHENGSMG